MQFQSLCFLFTGRMNYLVSAPNSTLKNCINFYFQVSLNLISSHTTSIFYCCLYWHKIIFSCWNLHEIKFFIWRFYMMQTFKGFCFQFLKKKIIQQTWNFLCPRFLATSVLLYLISFNFVMSILISIWSCVEMFRKFSFALSSIWML